jgi:hypothetical protein
MTSILKTIMKYGFIKSSNLWPRGSVVVEALCYKTKGRGIASR